MRVSFTSAEAAETSIKKISLAEARRLDTETTSTSVDGGLLSQYSELSNAKGLAIFSASDVESKLGPHYLQRLNKSGIKAVTVPDDMAKAHGYKGESVILDVIALRGRARFNIQSNPAGGDQQKFLIKFS